MAAEGDGFTLLVSAIGVSAVAASEFRQRQMARDDVGRAELFDFGGFEDGRQPPKLGNPALADSVRIYSKSWRPGFRRRRALFLELGGTFKSHSRGTGWGRGWGSG